MQNNKIKNTNISNKVWKTLSRNKKQLIDSKQKQNLDIINNIEEKDKARQCLILKHQDILDQELKHYGVPGMKWGQRKFSNKELEFGRDVSSELSRGLSSISKNMNNSVRSGKKSKKMAQDLSKMSNYELSKRVKRLDMEQKYISLSPNKKAAGARYAKSILDTVGGLAAIAATSFSIALAVGSLKQK